MHAVLFEKLLPVVSEYSAPASGRAAIALPRALPQSIASEIDAEHKVVDAELLS